MLLYHRIADLPSDPQCLGVSPAHFADHLDVVRTHGVLMTLEDLVNAARDGRLPPNAVAITFDDGYEDNLQCAVPLLADAHAPATVFVATGTLERGGEFWWDEVERLVLQPGALPRRVQLKVGGRVAEWDLTGTTEWTAGDCARYSAWTVNRAEAPTPRHTLYRDLCVRLQRVPGAAREETLEELSVMAGKSREPRPTHRPLRAADVAALARSDRIAIGSHTESHTSLSHLALEEQRREIAGARRRLESLTAMPVTTLAYPFGGPHDISDDTAAIAREEGIAIACSTEPGVVQRGTNPHRIPRVIVRNWPRSAFIEHWSEWTAAS